MASLNLSIIASYIIPNGPKYPFSTLVIGGDMVIVLDRGQVIEQGHPQVLLNDINGHFHKMAKTAGIV